MNSKLRENFLKTGNLDGIKIIDTHTHMGDVYGTHLSISKIEECVKLMENCNVESIWCAPHCDLFDPQSINHEIEKIMTLYPEHVKGYFSFNPNYADLYFERIKDMKNFKGYIGYKLLPEYHKTSLDEDSYQRVLEIANKNEQVVLIHTWGHSLYNSPKHIEKILKKFNKLKLIMGHSAPNESNEAIRLAREFPNAYLDLCDIHRHAGVVGRMVKGATSKKILFGTDLPWYDFSYCIGSVLFADIADEDMQNIFYNNAKTIINNLGVSSGTDN